MKIIVCGLGAIGSNLLVQMVKQFPDLEYEGVDFDKVEDRNIRTQAYFVEHVGALKAVAMRGILMRYVRKLNYRSVPLKVTAMNPPVEQTLVIDCFDNAASRALLHFPNAPTANVIHIGFSPLYAAEFIWDREYSVPNDIEPGQLDICSMDDAVGFVNFVVNLSVMNIAHFVSTGKKRSFLISDKYRIKWM